MESGNEGRIIRKSRGKKGLEWRLNDHVVTLYFFLIFCTDFFFTWNMILILYRMVRWSEDILRNFFDILFYIKNWNEEKK